MALIVADRVKETCSSPGTGSATLLGAATGYRTFLAAVGNSNTCYYTIADQGGANWEVGIGTYATSGNTLARTTVLASSNAGSLTNFSSGTQDVFVSYPAEVAAYASNNSAQTSGQIFTSNGPTTAPTWQNSSKYLGVLLYGGTTTSVPTTNGYLDVLLNSGSHTSVPVN